MRLDCTISIAQLCDVHMSTYCISDSILYNTIQWNELKEKKACRGYMKENRTRKTNWKSNGPK